MKIRANYKEKIKRLFGIRSPSVEAAKFGKSIAFCFVSGMQKADLQKVKRIYQPYKIPGAVILPSYGNKADLQKVKRIYQPYEIPSAVILPSYGNVDYIVRKFEWTKRELLFD